MNKKQRTDLDIISRIDDEIIDKNTKKRVELLNKKRAPRWVIPSGISAAVVAVLLIPIFIMLFAKQVPVYEGMTVSHTNSSGVENAAPNGNGYKLDFLANNGNGNNGNHYGNNKKPIDEIIEEDTSVGIEIPEQLMYYANPDQDIYITVHISNPDSYEILSFTLNGKKYSSYMFEDGSDMENLILKVNVGSEAGIREYTIDAIKYVDGTDIKDVDMRGERTVKVGIYSAGIQPTVNVTNELVGINDVSFTAELSDSYDLIERSGGKVFAGIFSDDGIVAYKQIEKGTTDLTFDGLDTYTSYRYGVVAYYDALDGNEMDFHVLYEKEFTTHSVLAPDNVKIDQTGISFGLKFSELFESKKLTSLTLYHGKDKVKEFDVSGDLATKIFSATELLSNNEYKIVIVYENVGKTETVEFTMTTEAKATPDLTLTEIEKTQTSFKFDIVINDVDSIGAITKIELVHGEDVQNVEDLTAREFTDLLSNNDYTVKITYTYDLNDGAGEQIITKELTVKTKAKAEPAFTFKDVTADMCTISGAYGKTNVDDTLISYTVSLYRGDGLVKQNTDKEIAFDSLDYYTEYTVKITYTFDVNDGRGVQQKTSEYKVKTLPYIDVLECNIANTSAVSEGDTIFMSVTLDNPLGMTVESVIINGETYGVTGESTKNRIFVEIVYNGQFAGGDTYLNVDKINAKIDETALAVQPQTELSDNVFINGKLEVIKMEFVNVDLEPIDWVFPSKNVYVMITLDNPTGYTVNSIDVGSDVQLIRIDDDHWYFAAELYSYSWVTFSLMSLSYSNEYISKTVSCSDMSCSIYRLTSDEIQYVSTADDLKNMNGGYYYELTQDIDLSGIEWIGNEFNGVFDGKGYSIKNMSYVSTIKSKHANLGLFTIGQGCIQNVNMEKVTVIAEWILDNENDDPTLRYGSLVAAPLVLYVKNCSTDADSFISIISHSTQAEIAVGGLVGSNIRYDGEFHANNIIENCINRASVHLAGEYGGNVGGISGHTNNDIIQECINYGTVSGMGSAGGICGYGESGYITKCINYGAISSANTSGGISGGGGNIFDCINYGSVTGVECVGGIAGWGGNDIIANCLNIGEVNGKTDITAGIAGVRWNSKIGGCINLGAVYTEDISGFATVGGDDGYLAENCYGIEKYNDSDVTCTVLQLNSKEFYTEALGWSEDVWDLSELDFENGKYPKLK